MGSCNGCWDPAVNTSSALIHKVEYESLLLKEEKFWFSDS